ncbi:Cyclase [Pleurostoma richardsiae]|uniref:Cyclase n=1 Tax=Pleurostoma richardsiae TaxID=41990 RepID=A0AA38RSD1_9PEZI|nr:Cyclase [Pleurostoma richardsiae]
MPTQYENPLKIGELLPTLQEIVESEKPSGVPREAAWIWGPNDEIGRLNLLTSDNVKSAIAHEQKHGLVSSLNWDMTLPKRPGFGRRECERHLEGFGGILVNDDILHMNTQSGSQFDGLRHVAHQSCKTFYNGLTQEEIASTSTRCGIQAASKHGIVGRGVLLDFARWAEETGLKYNPLETYAISLDQLLAVANWAGVEFQCGDILLIRTGWIRQYNQSLAQGLEKELAGVADEHPHAIGVEPSEEMKTWLHDQYFAVVGGDQPAFEAWPPQIPMLHEFLLACWGILIGEMLDLEDLSEKCRQAGKYSFLFVSTPWNLPGAVASLANAIAIL